MDSVRRRADPGSGSIRVAGNQGHNLVVDADIQAYFDNIQRDTLLELLKERISNRRRNPRLHFMQRWPCPKATKKTPRPCARVDQRAAEREGWKADHRGTDTRTSRLGKLLPNGKPHRGVQKDGRIPDRETAAPAVSARLPANREASRLYPGSGGGNGFAQIARDREIPRASHTKKIEGKPCAGKRHARFERGIWKQVGCKPAPRQVLPTSQKRPALFRGRHFEDVIII